MRRLGRSCLVVRAVAAEEKHARRRFSTGMGSAAKTSHEDVVRREFAYQARKGYDNQPASNARMMKWIERNMTAVGALQLTHRVLDVSAGTGRMSRLVAPYVNEVVAVDLSENMMAVGKEKAQEEGLHNIKWQTCNAKRLPFEDSSFDVVMARLAVHHWEDPHEIINEMSRTCRPGGRVVLIDRVIPPNTSANKEQRMNQIEKLRDPSHIRLWRLTDLTEFLAHARPPLSLIPISESVQELIDNEVTFDQWLGVTSEGESRRDEIMKLVEHEIQHGHAGGMRASRTEDGTLRFLFTYAFCCVVRSF